MDELYNAIAAKAILDSAEKSEDDSGEGLFGYGDHVALSGSRRIKRGAMRIQRDHRINVLFIFLTGPLIQAQKHCRP